MFKVSQLISLPVINVYSLKIEGYIENACFDIKKKTLQYLKVYNEHDDTYKSLKFNDIFTISESAVYITNSSKITLYENNEYIHNQLANPINSQVFAINSTYKGVVQDINIDANGHIVDILASSITYPSKTIVGISNELVLISTDKQININRYKPATRKIKTTISSIETEPVVTILQKQNIYPHREITNYQFLINRRILKDIKNQNGEIIARQNTLISANTINRLKYYGKLKELTLNSK